MTYGSLFSGCGGMDMGLEAAGMECLWQCEIDRQCRSVLARHWPGVLRIDNVIRLRAIIEHATATRVPRPRLLCGGFPCQDLSVAGRRAGLAGGRSGLWWTFRRIIGLLRPEWLVIENVPGLLSSNRGRDFGAVLGSLGRMGYGFAYRILDAQWFGVPQRRRRVFVVGRLGDWRGAAEILFERDGLPWDSPPSREAGTRAAGAVTGRIDRGGVNSEGHDGHLIPALARSVTTREGLRLGDSQDTLIPTAFAQNQRDEVREMPVAGALAAEPGMKQQTYVYQCHGSNVGEMGTLRAGNGNESGGVPFVADTLTANWQRSNGAKAGNNAGVLNPIINRMGVRRLMPIECERLQGFPDDWTRYGANGEELADSARYRMCGNAVAVPCVEWIARRIMDQEPQP